MGPNNELDYILGSLIMIIGALMNANALALMMVLMDEVNNSDRKIQDKI